MNKAIKWLFIGFGIAGIISLGIYIYLRVSNIVVTKATWISIAKWGGIVFGAGILVWFIVFLVKRFSGSNTISDLPKEIVHVSVAKRIWIEEFIKNTGIPYCIDRWDDDKVKPLNKYAIRIRNTRSFSDPNYQTSNRFWRFDAIVSEGDMIGTHVVMLQLSFGEEWIKNNWEEMITHHMTANRFELQPQRFPLTSSKEDSMRILQMKMELENEGEWNKDLEAWYQQANTQNKTTPKIEMVEEKKPEQQAQIIYADEEEATASDLDSDISNYRNKRE